MPPRTRVQSEYLKKRIAAYFAKLLEEKNASKKKLGMMLGVSTSRVNQWMSGDRGMMPEIAFFSGEQFRKNGWQTSGIEFLWAAGFWSEVLTVIKVLSVGSSVTEAALILFCWLPYRMIDFERALVKDRLLNTFGITLEECDIAGRLDEFAFSGSVASVIEVDAAQGDLERLAFFARSDPGARECAGFLNDHAALRRSNESFTALDEGCNTSEFHDAIDQAWRQRMRSHVVADVKNLGMDRIANLFDLYLIDGIIGASRLIDGQMFPSFAIPKLWRLCTGWFHEIGDSGPTGLFPALPDHFMTVSDRVFIRQEALLDEMRSTAAHHSVN
jgi:hypothetical protein